MTDERATFAPLPGGGYAYELAYEGVRVELRYLRRERHQLWAEVDVQCNWAGASVHEGSLSCAELNLSNQQARQGRASYCAQRARTKDGAFDWIGVIDAACLLTIRAERKGDDVIVLDDAPPVANRDVDVYGLGVPTDAASLLIAHGDSLKSLVILLVLGTLAQRGMTTLLLDWEWTADRHKERKCRLFGHDRIEGLLYQKCRAPLVIEADRIRRYCDLHRVDFVAVDSVGLACDGKLIDDDVAIRFHRALGTLPPALCAAHVPKSAVSADPNADPIGPFGSVFFSNLCRMSWLVKKQPGVSPDLVTLGMFPQKQNSGARQRPVGLEFNFDRETIGVRSINLADVDGMSQRLPIATRVAHALKQGPMTYTQLADQIGAKLDSVEKAVKRSDGFQRVCGPDGVTRIALVERRIA